MMLRPRFSTCYPVLPGCYLAQPDNCSALARVVHRLNLTLLQRRQRQCSSPHWWVEQEEGRPLHPTQFGDWMRAEGRYLSQLLQGPLYWWGICDIVLSSDDR